MTVVLIGHVVAHIGLLDWNMHQVSGFFEALGAIEFHVFQPLKVLGDADCAIGLVHLEATDKATGRRVVEPGEIHICHFNDCGQVQRFRHAADTWQHAMALKND